MPSPQPPRLRSGREPAPCPAPRRQVRIDGCAGPCPTCAGSIDFYCGALGFEPVPGTAAASVGVRLRLGDQHIDLRLAQAPMPPARTRTRPALPACRHRRRRHGRRLEAAGVARGGEHQPRRSADAACAPGGVAAFKFRDPDGHPLELIQFPAGVGDPRWQAKSGVLAPDQFRKNVATAHPDERVEYAIKLPGRDSHGEPVWLPIDAKFPFDDYQRLMYASERGDAEAVDRASRQLEGALRVSAKDLSDKYLAPPRTTDFGILFLPSEALYAEAMRYPGLADSIQREYRVVLAGPSTVAAILSALLSRWVSAPWPSNADRAKSGRRWAR